MRILFASIVLLLSTVATAEEIAAGLVKVSTPVYQPVFDTFDPPIGEYTFDVGWQGIPAATAKVAVEFDGLNYKISTSVKTSSFVDLFYRLRYQGEGLVSAVDLSPVEAYIYHRENSKEKTTKITFHADGNIESVRGRKVGKDDPTEERITFRSDNFTLDPFSAVFLARSLTWKEGDSREFDTFNGKSRYLITLTCIGTERVRVGDSYRDAVIISPSVKNLTNPDSDKKLRSAKIYLSNDNAREVLKIESSVFIGKVSTKLASFSPQPTSRVPEALALQTVDKKTRIE